MDALGPLSTRHFEARRSGDRRSGARRQLAGIYDRSLERILVLPRRDDFRRRSRSAEKHHRQAAVWQLRSTVDFHLTDEQEMLREGVGRFVQENYGFDVRRAVAAADPAFSAAQWQHFADLGWLALTLPEDAGGLGCTAIESALVTEQLGSALVLEPYATTAVFAARILEQAADAAIRQESLGAIGEGRLRVAVAHAEPGVRYDLGRAAATARRDGTGYRISGAKILVQHAPSAHQLIVSARLGEGAGLRIVSPRRPSAGCPDAQLPAARCHAGGGPRALRRAGGGGGSAHRLRAGPARARGSHRPVAARAGGLCAGGHAKRARHQCRIRQVARAVRAALIQISSDAAPVGRDVRGGAGSSLHPVLRSGAPRCGARHAPAHGVCGQGGDCPGWDGWWAASASSCTAASA